MRVKVGESYIRFRNEKEIKNALLTLTKKKRLREGFREIEELKKFLKEHNVQI